MDNPKCPYCGEETLLVGSKAYGWHYICNCGAASPVASNPDEAYAAAMKRDRKKGKWIERIDEYSDGNVPNVDWYCSVCGEDGINDYNYCPNCGARMNLTNPRLCPSCGADMRREKKDE